MIDERQYMDGEGASHALVGALVEALGDAESQPLAEGVGFHVGRSGQITDWSALLDHPRRRIGLRRLREPESFADVVNRLEVPGETTLWADLDGDSITAVFDDDQVTQIVGTEGAWRQDRAILALAQSEDWAAWTRMNGQIVGQRAFGEFIEDQAHCIIRPSSAEMLEVATTLTAKRTLDYGSRTRLDNGDMEFKFVEETSMRAGRAGASVEIPSSFTVAVSPWVGTKPVEIVARLRVRPDGDGVKIGFRFLRLEAAKEQAFRDLTSEVHASVGDGVPLFYGNPA
jgi:uncharacterized protein YfdQ (DUF2303 family)